jgi:hypothetical protein
MAGDTWLIAALSFGQLTDARRRRRRRALVQRSALVGLYGVRSACRGMRERTLMIFADIFAVYCIWRDTHLIVSAKPLSEYRF